MIRLRVWAAALALSATSQLHDAQADTPASIDTLFAEMARSPGFFARFHEEKQIALLVVPLKNDGTLHYERQHGLARHTLAPQKQSLLLSRGTLSMWDGQKTETVSLQGSAPLRALSEAFSLMLAADRAGLERSFTLGFQVSGQTWRLALVPTSADLKKLVTEIDLSGEGLVPKMLKVREASGDESTTTLTDVDMNKRYTDTEAAAIFKVPPG